MALSSGWRAAELKHVADFIWLSADIKKKKKVLNGLRGVWLGVLVLIQFLPYPNHFVVVQSQASMHFIGIDQEKVVTSCQQEGKMHNGI